MLQTTDGIMISVICLVVIACVSKSLANTACATNSEGFLNTECGKREKIYQSLKVAAELIEFAKDEIRTDRPSSSPLDCEDLLSSGVNTSGVYLVWPKNRLFSGPISVYCDMDTDGGGWTVIQRRGNFSRRKDYFFQDWNAYKKGFGNYKEDFWLGNDKIYALSNQRHYSIRFDLGSFSGNRAYAVYDNFWIDDENYNYTLHVSGYRGNAGDSFSHQNGRRFATKDRDNGGYSNNCADYWRGAWWFASCHPSHLNGEYYTGKLPKEWDGIIWEAWRGSFESLAFTEMKIRKTPF